MPARSSLRDQWTLRAAELAGRALRASRGLPGIVGPLLVAVGLGMAWLPLGVIAAGAALWAWDLAVAVPADRPAPRHFGDGRLRPTVGD